MFQRQPYPKPSEQTIEGATECMCYPECRIDCSRRDQCLRELPEYQSKRDRARFYAEAVRARNPHMQVKRIEEYEITRSLQWAA